MNLGQEACVKYAEDGIIGSEAKLELCFFPPILYRIIVTTMCKHLYTDTDRGAIRK